MPDTDIRSELVGLRRSLARLEQQAGLTPSPLAVPSEGYRLVNPGDVVQADDHNMAIAQSITRFTNAAARNAAMTAPMEGMHAYLKDVDQTQVYDGATWQPRVQLFNASGVAVTVDSTTRTGATLTIDAAKVPRLLICSYLCNLNGAASKMDIIASMLFSHAPGDIAGYQFNMDFSNSVNQFTVTMNRHKILPANTATTVSATLTRQAGTATCSAPPDGRYHYLDISAFLL
jgi:hypothetical protein